MKIRSVLIPLFLFLLSMNSVAQEYIRYNSAGYFTKGQKKIVVFSNSQLEGRGWTLQSASGSTAASGTIGENISGKGEHSAYNFNYRIDFSSVTTAGDYIFTLAKNSEKIKIKIADYPYNSVIAENLRFLKVQRSGDDDAPDHVAGHKGDSACYVYRQEKIGDMAWKNWKEDANGLKVDIAGGWYASGNYGKFTSAIGYTTYYLLKAYESNPSFFDNNSELSPLLDEAKFGLAYLLKVMPTEKDFIMQVGGFDGENGIRLPHEDIYEGKRVAYSSFSAPQMAWAASALAIGSKVFGDKGDALLSEKCKALAIKIYKKATSPEATISWLQKDYEQFKDDSKGDNLLIAAAELHNLTGNASYLTDAKKFSDEIKNAWWVAWNMQHMMGHSLITAKHEPAKGYFMGDLNNFYGNSKNNIWGFPMEYGFSSLYASLEIGIAASRYQLLSGKKKFNDMLSNIIDYEFGVNNWGVSFHASKSLPNSAKKFNLPIYKLQTHLFPTGALALGPCDKEGHEGESKWILDDVRANYCHPYNTPKVQFYDHADDYMTTDVWISGLADNIYFLTLVSTLFNK